MWRWLPVVLVAVAGAADPAAAQPAPGAGAFAEVEQALPAGWTMLATGSELVFRHDRPCYVTGVHHENAPPAPTPVSVPGPAARPTTPAGGGPLVTLELRYRLEPRWTAPQLAAGKAANARTGRALHALALKYRVAQIHHSKGRPLPANPDERARLDAYDSEHAKLAKQLVALPRCSVGELSVFDGEDTYAQLTLELDPPDAITQAHQILALMKQHCG